MIKIFLRIAIATGFLSAVADRFGFWNKEVSAWGNWDNFLEYTKVLNPSVPIDLIPIVGATATIAEIVFAICLIIGFKTELFAKLSGYLILLFALAMTFTYGIKGTFDYSVFIAAAAAFALSTMKVKVFEFDTVLTKNKL
ncbi:DoxX family protein [Winogradskyella sp.]|uniref:DoxX family protein n=1 Tax=Winogradskyella sp. TaxID=1883156 RepID=UPI0025E2C793|nr:DoxX family protein [Winogradskyella sp.]